MADSSALRSLQPRPSAHTGGQVRGIFATAGAVAALSVVVKGGTAVRELLVAWFFGTSDPLDAYLIGYAVPYFAVTLLAGSLPYVLVPAYLRVRAREGSTAAEALAGAVLGACTVGLVGLALIMAVAAPWYVRLVGYGFPPEKLAGAARIAVILAPTVLSGALISLLVGLLNAHQRFLAPALSPLISSGVMVASLLLLGSHLGVDALAYGLLAGSALELAWLYVLSKQHLKLTFAHGAGHPHMGEVGRSFLPTLVGSALMASTLLVDQAMSTGLPAGSVAALNYATRLVTLPLGLTAAALGTVVLPHYSERAAQGDWRGLHTSTRRYLRLIGAVTVPLAILIGVLAWPATDVLLNHGAFTGADVSVVAACIAALAPQVPFYTGVILLMRLALSLRLNTSIAIISGVNLALNVVLNAWLAPIAGVAGIALSTSLVYVCSFVLLLIRTERALKRRQAMLS